MFWKKYPPERGAYGKLKLQLLYVAGAMTKCLFRRGVRLSKAETAAFVCCWGND